MPELAEVQKGITVFAGEVVSLDKTLHRPGRLEPPDGIANEHGVVAGPVVGGGIGQGNQLQRARLFLGVLHRNTALRVIPVQISAGVGVSRGDLKEVGVQLFGDGPGGIFGVAGG